MTPASFPRRLAAFFIDYAVIAAWLAALTAAAFATGLAQSDMDLHSLYDRLQRHALAFGTVTLPIVIGFAAFEASPLQGSPGKRLMGLRVVRVDGAPAGFGATLLRNALKFLPWEIAHLGIWHMPGRPFVDPPAAWNMALWIAALLVAAVYAASLAMGSRRTPYDRIAGVLVSRRYPASPDSA